MLRKISVKGLIGQRFEVKLTNYPSISFIYGGNGSGKSLFLKMTYYLLSNQDFNAVDIPFYQAKIMFDEEIFVFRNTGIHIQTEDKKGNVLQWPVRFPVHVNYYEPEMIYDVEFRFPESKDNKRNRVFKSLINSMFKFKTLKSFHPLRFRFETGTNLTYDQLSHGERRIFLIWYKIVFNPKGTIIILDEPDRSMGIELQREFLPTFLKLNEKYRWNHQMIFTSHSPSIPSKLLDYRKNWVQFKNYSKEYWHAIDMIETICKHYEGDDAFHSLLHIASTETGDKYDDAKIRTRCIRKALKFAGARDFETVELLMISDEDASIRMLAARHIIYNFLKEGLRALEWTIQHDNAFVLSRLKTGIESLEESEYKDKLVNIINENYPYRSSKTSTSSI